MYKIINEQGVQVGRKAMQVKRNILANRADCKEGFYTFVNCRNVPVFKVEYRIEPVANGNKLRVRGKQFKIQKT